MGGVAFFGVFDIAETGFVEVVFVGVLRSQFTMHNKRAADCFYIEATSQIINHFLIVSVSGEPFNLGDLRFYFPVVAKDTYPFQVWILNTCTL